MSCIGNMEHKKTFIFLYYGEQGTKPFLWAPSHPILFPVFFIFSIKHFHWGRGGGARGYFSSSIYTYTNNKYTTIHDLAKYKFHSWSQLLASFIFTSMVNTTSESLKSRNVCFIQYFKLS